MQKNTTLFFFLFLMCATSVVWGKTITVDQAREVAQNFFKTTVTTRGTFSMKLVHQPVQSRAGIDAQYYVFAPEAGKGFVIVSGDDALTPVIGYSPVSIFDGSQMPDGLQAWLAEYIRYVDDVRAGKAVAYRHELQTSQTRTNMAVEPFVDTRWDQGAPYNDQCPLVGGVRSPSGCTATAMAQAMKYYNWPEQAEGTAIFQGGTINLSGNTYDWDNMINDYQAVTYTQLQGAAVAKLMSDCGRAIDSRYGAYSTGALVENVAKSLVANFKYSPEVRCIDRYNYTTTEWIGLVRENLLLKQPVVYAGFSTVDGHAFICDGIDENNMLHMNWGWSGYCDGYFEVNNLVPDGTGIGGGAGYYYLNQKMVINIRPKKENETAPLPGMVVEKLDISGESTKAISVTTTDVLFNLKVSMWNVSGVVLNGSVALGVQEVDGSWRTVGELLPIANLDSNRGWRDYSWNLSINLKSGSENYFPVGTYKLKFVFKHKDGDKYVPLDNYWGAANNLELLITEKQATLRAVSPAEVELVSATLSNTKLYPGENGSFILKFKNTGDQSFVTNIYPTVVPKGFTGDITKSIVEESAFTFSSYDHSEMECAFSLTFKYPGEYEVHYLSSLNGITFEPISDKVTTVMVSELSAIPVPYMTQNLQTYDVSQGSAMSIYMYLKSVSSTFAGYRGSLAFCAVKGDDASGAELVLSQIEVTLDATERGYSYQSSDFTAQLRPGAYTLYLKYLDGGEWKKIDGKGNSASFSVTSPEWPVPFIVSDISINGGKPIEQGATFKVKFMADCTSDYIGRIWGFTNIANNGSTVAVVKGDYQNVSLTAGNPQEVELTCVCQEDAPLGTYMLSVAYTNEKDDGYGYYISRGLAAQLSTAVFTVTKYTGIENDTAASADCYVISQPNCFLLKGIQENARVQVNAMNGTVLYKGIAKDEELSITMNSPVGVYLIIVENPNGKVRTMKAVLKSR